VSRNQGKALRTETTINDTRDFKIGKRLTNLPALREAGFSAAMVNRVGSPSARAVAAAASTSLSGGRLVRISSRITVISTIVSV